MNGDDRQLSQRPQQQDNNLATLLNRPEYKNRFDEVMGLRAPQFMSSLLQLSMNNLRDAEPRSILAAGLIAASLDLPINPNLGFAYIIPYKSDGRSVAQFQMGYKGYVQLAMRSRQYARINACRVFEGELVKYDKLTGDLVIDEALRKSDEVIGYASYFRLTNGFEHAIFMTADQVNTHAKKYSQAYRKGYSSIWKDDFDAMALKTVLKQNLSKWGPLNVQMERAMYNDQAVRADVDSTVTFPDNPRDIPGPVIGGPSDAAPMAALKAPGEPLPQTEGVTEVATPAPAPETAEKVVKRPRKPSGAKLQAPPPVAAEEVAAPVATKQETAAEVPELGPHVKELRNRLNEAGYLFSSFLQLAVAEEWLDAPKGYTGDPADLDGMIVDEAKAVMFLEPENWKVVVEWLETKKKKAPEKAPERNPFA